MSVFFIFIHVVVCIALILIVLLQTGKGADMGAAFGGGSSQTLFGSGGVSPFLSKLTTIAAVIFMFTSLILAYMSGHKEVSSIMTDAVVPPPASTEGVPEGLPPTEGMFVPPEEPTGQATEAVPETGTEPSATAPEGKAAPATEQSQTAPQSSPGPAPKGAPEQPAGEG